MSAREMDARRLTDAVAKLYVQACLVLPEPVKA